MQMKTRVAGVLATSAAAVAMMGAPAFASTANHHGAGDYNVGNVSVLSGNTVNIPIFSPVNVCGNAIAIFQLPGQRRRVLRQPGQRLVVTV